MYYSYTVYVNGLVLAKLSLSLKCGRIVLSEYVCVVKENITGAFGAPSENENGKRVVGFCIELACG